MLKLMSMATVLLFSAVLFAEDAAAPPAGPVFTTYGLAQYRLRAQIFSQKNDSVADFKEMDYANRIVYYLGLKIKVNEQVSMQFQAGNDWVPTEDVTWLTNENPNPISNSFDAANKSGLYPYFHLASVKYDAGFMYLVAGKIAVASNGPLDLLERSLRPAGNYAGAACISWVVGTNGTMSGLKLGAPILKDNFKLGAELFTTVTEFRKQTLAVDPKSNPSAVMFVLDVPMSGAALTITPQVTMVLNKVYNPVNEKGDNETGAGLTAGYKIKDGVTVKANFGLAMISNKNSADTTFDAANPAVFDNNGLMVGAGTAVKVGRGNAYLDIQYSTDENKNVADSKSSYLFGDVKYGFNCNKNFVIMPRVRFFMTTYAKTDMARESKLEIRPELMFTGQF